MTGEPPRGVGLALESSNPSAIGRTPGPGVAIGRDGRVDHVEPLRAVGRHEDDLLPCVERAWQAVPGAPTGAAGTSRLTELALVAVSIGPGGYTSLRIACATAQMLALAAGEARGPGAPPPRCVGVPTAAVVAASLRRPRVGGVGGAPSTAGLAVALAGKQDAAFVTFFAAGWAEGEAVPAGELLDGPGLQAAAARWGPGAVLAADRHVPGPVVEAARRAGWGVAEPMFDPAACLRLGWAMATVGGAAGAGPEVLVPLYGREPEAVTLWRARRGGLGGMDGVGGNRPAP